MTSSHDSSRHVPSFRRRSIAEPKSATILIVSTLTILLFGMTLQWSSVALGSVFGVDDRTAFDQIGDRPWSAIGRVEVRPEAGVKRSSLPICTATMIGPDEIITNAHCIVKSGLPELISSNLIFKAGLNDGNYAARARIVSARVGTTDPDRRRGRDWAIAKLDKPIGHITGWLPIDRLSENASATDPRLVTFVSYATDFEIGRKAFRHEECQIVGFEPRNDFFRHDCDMNAGSSGGPLLVIDPIEGPTIVAINAAHVDPNPVSYVEQYSRRQANVAVGSTRFLPKVTTEPSLISRVDFELTQTPPIVAHATDAAEASTKISKPLSSRPSSPKTSPNYSHVARNLLGNLLARSKEPACRNLLARSKEPAWASLHGASGQLAIGLHGANVAY